MRLKLNFEESNRKNLVSYIWPKINLVPVSRFLIILWKKSILWNFFSAKSMYVNALTKRVIISSSPARQPQWRRHSLSSEKCTASVVSVVAHGRGWSDYPHWIFRSRTKWSWNSTPSSLYVPSRKVSTQSPRCMRCVPSYSPQSNACSDTPRFANHSLCI